MQNNLLKPLIARIQKQDMTAFPIVFEEFKKLINFYGAKLHYEDATSELTLFLIELLYDLKLSKFESDDSNDIKRYIAVSLKNKYLALSVLCFKSLKFENDLLEENCGYFEKLENRFLFTNGAKKLNDIQRLVVIYHFVYGYSIAEIAEILNLSRQWVNKTKNQALTILREALTGDEDYFV